MHDTAANHSAVRPRTPRRPMDTIALPTGIATVCLSGTLDDKLNAAAGAGFDGVEIFENDLVASAASPEEISGRCADLGLTVDLYQPFRNFEAVPPETLRANLRRATRKFELMQRLGAELMLVCSSVASEVIDDDDVAAEQLHALACLAAEHGVRIAYEALAWGEFVNTYDHAWQIVRRADHDALGVCLDSFHILSREKDPAGIRDIPGDKLFFLQLADAPRMNLDLLEWSRHYRLFPGQGSFDLPAFVDHALAAGYEGPLSLEVFNDVFRQADPVPVAIDAMRSLCALRERVGATHEPDTDHGHPAPASVAHGHLPKGPGIEGQAFTELAVDGDGARDAAETLQELGFTRTGTHRWKPVELWCQGTARVLLNRGESEEVAPAGASPAHHLGAGETAVAAIGLHTAEPAQSALRAQRLLAPVLPHARKPGDADLASVAAPDGTEVFFCREHNDDSAGWLSDFAPTYAPAQPGIGITRTDHIALTQPFDHFDTAVLFYRSVLGLETECMVEFAAPFGLVRTYAVTDPEHRVRITLDSAVLRRGEWAPAINTPQHVAFAADDAIASARMAHVRGAPILTIPDNYYDDLDARFELPPQLLAQMRRLSVLYDRDAHGEFLHFYTEIIGSRVFFEVVQRIHDYTGYGADNAPIRMAAHRRRRLQHEGG